MSRRMGDGVVFVAPALALLSLVTFYPLAYLLYLSLHHKLLIFQISRFSGLDNYLFLLHDLRFWNALKNTVYFTALSVSLELLLGLAMALILAGTTRFRGIVTACVLVPWAIPSVVSARMWEWMYSAGSGVLNYLLHAHINWLGSPMLSMHAAVIMDVWKTTPFVAVLLLSGLMAIPREFYQAAALDGAGAWSTFRFVTLPLLKPVIFVAAIFRILDAFRVFDAVYVLTGGGPADSTETVSIYTYKILFQTLQFGYGSALSVAVFGCMALISLLLARAASVAK